MRRVGKIFAAAVPVAAVIVCAPAAAAESDTAQAQTTASQGWSYHITSSCEGNEESIRTGADFWGGAETEDAGTPVHCQSAYISDCDQSGDIAIGCNYGDGNKIVLSTQAADFALIAAHEFGHNTRDHSNVECMSWESADTVMAPTMC